MIDDELKQYLDGKFAAVDSQFAAVDSRFAALDSKFAALDSKFAAVDSKFAGLDSKFAGLDSKFAEERAALTEVMRDMQTELLRGFASFAQGQTIRLRKVEADQSNLDAALSGRVAVIESRLLEIELRLGSKQ